jgi:hypothetical protein
MALLLSIMVYCLAKIVPLNSPFLYSLAAFPGQKKTD